MIGMFVFFKQKKAYELRISDWRSDVCSSDLSATPAALMEGIAEGVYITELIGQGVNPVTGDYSRGASGFLIKDGIVAGPIAEFTIAGNLIDMFAALIPANDLEFRHGRSEEHTSELQSLMRISYAVFCLKKKR